MLKQRTHDFLDNDRLNKYRSKYTNQKASVQHQPTKTPFKQQKENNIDRLEYIRKKYSSKQKDNALKSIQQSKNYVKVEEYKPKQQVREQSKSYIRESYRDLKRQLNRQPSGEALKEYTREYSFTRIPLEQRQQRYTKQDYNYYKGVSRISQFPQQSMFSDNINIASYRPSNIDSSFVRSTSAYLGSREVRDVSAEKVSKRVQNIDKINERIKSILNVIDVNSVAPTIYTPEKSLISQSKIKPFKDKKAAYIYQTHSRLQCFDKSIIQFESKEQIVDSISPNDKIIKQLSTLKVQNHESERFIQQSQISSKKYTPRQIIQKHKNIQKSKPKSNQIEALMYKLSIQIQHDENLRTAKYFFLLSTLPDKYQILRHQLSLKGVNYSLQKLKQIMKFTQQQYNPFIYQSSHEDFSKFADAIVASTQYWQRNIFQKFSYEKLKQEKIDQILVFENKDNQLAVSDLVRFVNLGSGNLYKNRDLVLIARRISDNENKLSVEKIFRAFCDII